MFHEARSTLVPMPFEGGLIRIVDIDGEPWFVAKDVTEALGYVNAADAVSKHCKGVAKRYPLPTLGGTQEVRILNEPDVLRLIVSSKLPAAERFERWVFEEALPTIRKTGAYAPVHVPTSFAEALRLAADQAETIEAQQQQLEKQRPAVEFLDRYVEARSTKSLREVAKVLGIRERVFIDRLEAEDILFRQGACLLPSAVHQHRGYFEVKTGEANGHAFHQTRFTPAGVAWIAKRFGQVAA